MVFFTVALWTAQGDLGDLKSCPYLMCPVFLALEKGRFDCPVVIKLCSLLACLCGCVSVFL